MKIFEMLYSVMMTKLLKSLTMISSLRYYSFLAWLITFEYEGINPLWRHRIIFVFITYVILNLNEQVMQEPEVPDFDFDAHIARLIELRLSLDSVIDMPT